MFGKSSICTSSTASDLKDTKSPFFQLMLNFGEDSQNIVERSLLCNNIRGFDTYQNHNPACYVPRAIRGSCTDTNGPLVEQTPQTNVSCNDLSDKMNALSISQPGGISSFPTQQALDNLRALYELSQSSTFSHLWDQVDYWDPSTSTDTSDHGYDKTRNETPSTVTGTMCTWCGVLPPRFVSTNPSFSCKLFLGGVPWDVTENMLVRAFGQFGKVRVEWPGKEQAAHQPKGYVYIILECEKRVRALLDCCSCTVSSGNSKNWFFRIQSRKMKFKEVQVIPWTLEDSNFAPSHSQKIDHNSTVFVGALHGMMNAEGLFKVMNDLFGGVVYAGIDTDKFKYPIGSARVTFSNRRSFLNAVGAAFVQVKTPKFTKKLQVDPYLDDSTCSCCEARQGVYFCREVTCFRYFCGGCWALYHSTDPHKPLVRRSKTNPIPTFTYRSVSSPTEYN